MKWVSRKTIDTNTQNWLDQWQTQTNNTTFTQAYKPTQKWDNHRSTAKMEAILRILTDDMAYLKKCMYCVANLGTDIEHFWPKTPYPDKMFRWENMLFCCTDCGRQKLDQFPLDGNQTPMLINPSTENPWKYLEFDPPTGNLIAKFNLRANTPEIKGEKTVEALKLDERERLSESYQRSYRRLEDQFKALCIESNPVAVEWLEKLLLADENGLLEWLLFWNGQQEQFMENVIQSHPNIVDEIRSLYRTKYPAP